MTGPSHSTLASVRDFRKLTLRQVGQRIGVSHASVGLFEQGRYRLSTEKLRKYAKALGVKPREVEHHFLQAAYTYHVRRAREIRAALRKRGAKPKSRPKAII